MILSAHDGDDDTLFTNRASSTDLTEFHPSPAQIFHLWQVFLDTVHPILKIFHAPSLQKDILKTAFDLSSASAALHGLLQAIYANAVISMSGEDCTAILNEERSTLVSRYTEGTRCALQQAGFLVSTDIMVLQAYILYLVSTTISGTVTVYYCNLH